MVIYGSRGQIKRGIKKKELQAPEKKSAKTKNLKKEI